MPHVAIRRYWVIHHTSEKGDNIPGWTNAEKDEGYDCTTFYIGDLINRNEDATAEVPYTFTPKVDELLNTIERSPDSPHLWMTIGDDILRDDKDESDIVNMHKRRPPDRPMCLGLMLLLLTLFVKIIDIDSKVTIEYPKTSMSMSSSFLNEIGSKYLTHHVDFGYGPKQKAIHCLL